MVRPFTRLAAAVAVLAAAGCSDPKDPALSAPAVVAWHPVGWTEPGDDGFHGRALAAAGYDFSECIECHGVGTAGGIAEVSCTICHVSEAGPEACNTCHGDFDADASDLVEAAPPRGLHDETDPRARPVGAHRAHLALSLARPAADQCSECHTVPDALDSPGHLGEDLRAEVRLVGPIATTPSGGGLLEPGGIWDDGTATCRDSYCHGNWALPKALSDRQWMYSAELMRGNDATPRWDDPESGACESCHGLPPVGHDAAALHECVDCHGTVVNGDGEIVDPSRHVDGMVDLYDDPPYPMF